MAVTTEPKRVLELIQGAVQFCASFTDKSKALVKSFVGNHYCSSVKGQPAPENMILGAIASMVPQLAFDNPQVKVKPFLPVTGKDVARWMEQGLNQWIQVADIVDDLERAATDMLFCFAVLKVGVEPIQQASPEPGKDDAAQRMERHMPFLTHVPNTDYVFDPECKQWEKRRWEAMRLVRDLEDVRNDPAYDEAARQQVTAAWQAAKDSARLASMPKKGATEDRVELWEVYYLETNQIGILCETTKDGAVWLQPLAERKGPGSPYVLIGCYQVPGSPIPASILSLTADQFLELNAHAAAASREEANRKSIGIIDGDDKDAKIVRDTPNGKFAVVKGFTGKVANLDIGGTSAERIQFINVLRDRLDRIMGQSDAIRGTANGDKTATEVSVAQDNASVRVQLMQRHWRRGVREALRKAGWYLFYDPQYVQRGEFTGEDGQAFEGYFIGGPQPGREDDHWPDYNLSIEPMSMQRVDPGTQLRQAQMTVDAVMAFAPMVPQYPWVKWRQLLDMLGEAMNIENLYDLVMDEQALVQAMVMGMAAPIPPSGPQPTQANLPMNANPTLRARFGMQPMGGAMPMPALGQGPMAGSRTGAPPQGPVSAAGAGAMPMRSPAPMMA